MRIAIWSESVHNGMAGRRCDRDDPGDDAQVFEGTVEQLRAEAKALDAAADGAGAGHDLFLMSCASTIREEIGDEQDA